eukprot:CAMPEP_0198736814 /NCGR_PEP_ID=MMETSP1475-20131203/67550_1 /TAXON_ID= ORGANISM="Unidentified sp., Strain CCMP1999" /NCGR_SAMPLE_ID=MMETSP1475 /ASSEMBLY_ACC=CAM_ASM_001111 /LENGTH=521 /DNA_ID=CAMNT_0044500665 /DNA_START=223 /DNA_END=1788 /DNA_ORIENTATION=-
MENAINSRAGSATFGSEDTESAVVRQIEYYLGTSNLPTDYFLLSQMDQNYWVSIETLANFPKMRRFGLQNGTIARLLVERSSWVEVDMEYLVVRPRFFTEEMTRTVQGRQGSVLILREVAEGTSEEQIRALFLDENCPKPTTIRPDVANVWFVDFDGDEEARASFIFVREQTLNGKEVRARVKNMSTYPTDGFAPLAYGPPGKLYGSGAPYTVDDYPAGRHKGRARKTANGATRRGRKRSQSKVKEPDADGKLDGKLDGPESVRSIDEEVMTSGEHFPPLFVKTGEIASSSQASESHSEADDSNSQGSDSVVSTCSKPDVKEAQDAPAQDAPAQDAPAQDAPAQDGPTDKEPEASHETSPAACQSQMSYAAILRTRHATVDKVRSSSKKDAGCTGGPERQRGKDAQGATDKRRGFKQSAPRKVGRVAPVNRGESSESNTVGTESHTHGHTSEADSSADYGSEKVGESAAAAPKVSPVAQKSAAVWQNKPSAVLEAPALRCSEKQQAGSMKIDSAQQVIQSS